MERDLARLLVLVTLERGFDAGDLVVGRRQRGRVASLTALAEVAQTGKDVGFERCELLLGHLAEFHAHLPATLSPDTVVSVYPTQLLEVALGIVMFIILWRMRRHEHRAGWLFGLYCVLAGIERFIVEFFRAKGDVVGPLTSAQWVALAIGAVGVLLLTTRRTTTTLAVAR